MLVTTTMSAGSFTNVPSNSSDSTTIQSLSPIRALVP